MRILSRGATAHSLRSAINTPRARLRKEYRGYLRFRDIANSPGFLPNVQRSTALRSFQWPQNSMWSSPNSRHIRKNADQTHCTTPRQTWTLLTNCSLTYRPSDPTPQLVFWEKIVTFSDWLEQLRGLESTASYDHQFWMLIIIIIPFWTYRVSKLKYKKVFINFLIK